MRRLCLVLTLPLLLAACATTQSGREPVYTNGAAISGQAAESPAWPRETVRYQCEDDTRLQVAYLNLENGRSFAALYYDGRLNLMRPWPAASGVRYVSLDEQVGLRWHTKGDRGRLSFLAADHTAEEITLLSDCRAVEEAGR